MQRLVTIYLDNAVYGSDKWLAANYAEHHGRIEEHLKEELAAGWKIKLLQSFGGAAESIWARGWLAVVLEKD